MKKPIWLERNKIPLKAHLKYLSYVLRHKWWVLVAGLRIMRIVPVLLRPLFVWRLFIHDLSKFRWGEWWPYVLNFYTHAKAEEDRFIHYPFEGDKWGEHVDDWFNLAWLHHQRRNKHHWQYWLLRCDDIVEVRPLPMLMIYVCEMLADWMGAGRAITGRWEVRGWYLANRDKIEIAPTTRQIVNQIVVSMNE